MSSFANSQVKGDFKKAKRTAAKVGYRLFLPIQEIVYLTLDLRELLVHLALEVVCLPVSYRHLGSPPPELARLHLRLRLLGEIAGFDQQAVIRAEGLGRQEALGIFQPLILISLSGLVVLSWRTLWTWTAYSMYAHCSIFLYSCSYAFGALFV